MRDALIGRFVLVGKQPGTIIDVIPGTPKTPSTLKVKLHNVPTRMRDENLIVEVVRYSNEWRLQFPRPSDVGFK